MRYLFALFLFVCPLSAVGVEELNEELVGFLEGLQSFEWKKDCYQSGRFYFVSRIAVFDEHVSVSAEKWYKDPACQVQLGEFWEKWKIVHIEKSALGPDVFKIGAKLLDGDTHQCYFSWNIVSVKGDRLFLGNFYGGTEKELRCHETPTEFHKTPLILSGSVYMTADEYARQFKRHIPTLEEVMEK